MRLQNFRSETSIEGLDDDGLELRTRDQDLGQGESVLETKLQKFRALLEAINMMEKNFAHADDLSKREREFDFEKARQEILLKLSQTSFGGSD